VNRSILAATFAVVGWLASLAIASGQVPPTTVSSVTFAGVTPPADIELVQEIIDFAPGAWTPPQARGGELFVTVMEGQIARRSGPEMGYTESARSFRVPRGELHMLGNPSESSRARIFASTLLPSGANLTTNQVDAAIPLVAPTVAMTSRVHAPSLPPSISVIQVVWDFQPGAATPPHTHHGFFLVTVVDGQLGRITLEDGREQAYGRGQQFTEAPGRADDAIVRNASTGISRNVFTVLTSQVPPSTNLPPAPTISLPRTGEGGLLGREPFASHEIALGGIILAGAGLSLVGLRKLRQRRQAS
jgi:quercetin dioxygenase-like cupin family protein